jgi:hypothetical protein
MPEIVWTVDNPALLLMSQVSEIVADGLLPPAAESTGRIKSRSPACRPRDSLRVHPYRMHCS